MMKTNVKALALAALVGISGIFTSCASTQSCPAYGNKVKHNKHATDCPKWPQEGKKGPVFPGW